MPHGRHRALLGDSAARSHGGQGLVCLGCYVAIGTYGVKEFVTPLA